jgi:hypothetical protein
LPFGLLTSIPNGLWGGTAQTPDPAWEVRRAKPWRCRRLRQRWGGGAGGRWDPIGDFSSVKHGNCAKRNGHFNGEIKGHTSDETKTPLNETLFGPIMGHISHEPGDWNHALLPVTSCNYPPENKHHHTKLSKFKALEVLPKQKTWISSVPRCRWELHLLLFMSHHFSRPQLQVF